MLHYVKGDVTVPEDVGAIRVIVHVCNDQGGWGPDGKSVASAISKRWPEPEAEYRQQFAEGEPGLKLGEIQLVDVGPELWVANCVAQHGYRRPGNLTPFRAEFFEMCLDQLVNTFSKNNASFHMPRVGCGLGGSKWADVEAIVERALIAAKFDVFVYDL